MAGPGWAGILGYDIVICCLAGIGRAGPVIRLMRAGFSGSGRAGPDFRHDLYTGPTQRVSFRMILSDLVKYLMTRSIARYLYNS